MHILIYIARERSSRSSMFSLSSWGVEREPSVHYCWSFLRGEKMDTEVAAAAAVAASMV